MFSRTTENNNKQRDKKDQIDILTNNHDKKYHSTKHLKGLQYFMAFICQNWPANTIPVATIISLLIKTLQPDQILNDI